MAQTCTDFSSYATGASVPGWTTHVVGGASAASIAIEENASALSGKWLKATVTGGFWATVMLQWTAITDTDEGDLVVLIRYATGDEATGSKAYGPAGRMIPGATEDLVAGLIDFLDGSEADRLVYVNGGSQAGLASDASPALTYAAGTDYWVRFNFSGRNYKMKSWERGTTEPSAWNLEYTASAESDPTAAGDVGLWLNRLEPSSGDTDVVYVHFIGFSPDPNELARTGVTLFDNKTTDEGVGSDTFSHSQGSLTNGLAVVRAIYDGPGLSVTYDGNAMTSVGGGQTVDGVLVAMFYVLLGTSGSGSKTVAVTPGSETDNWTIEVCTYRGINQSGVVYDSDFGTVTGVNSLTSYLNSHTYGDLVVGVVGSSDGGSALTGSCPYVARSTDLGNTSADLEMDTQDVVSFNAATPIAWTLTPADEYAYVAATFLAAIDSYTPTFSLSAEHLLKVSPTFALSAEHLREIVEEVLNRKRLYVDVGADTRSLNIDI